MYILSVYAVLCGADFKTGYPQVMKELEDFFYSVRKEKKSVAVCFRRLFSVKYCEH